jgi:hypothetical protein
MPLNSTLSEFLVVKPLSVNLMPILSKFLFQQIANSTHKEFPEANATEFHSLPKFTKILQSIAVKFNFWW